MPGPAPNPNARRANDKNAWRTLPATCPVPVPQWPFGRRMSVGRARLWAQLWELPQAVMWHEMGSTRIVARYAVLSLAVQSATADPRTLSEVRQLEDRLLLSPQALVRARVLIALGVSGQPAVAGDEIAVVSVLDDYRNLGLG